MNSFFEQSFAGLSKVLVEGAGLYTVINQWSVYTAFFLIVKDDLWEAKKVYK